MPVPSSSSSLLFFISIQIFILFLFESALLLPFSTFCNGMRHTAASSSDKFCTTSKYKLYFNSIAIVMNTCLFEFGMHSCSLHLTYKICTASSRVIFHFYNILYTLYVFLILCLPCANAFPALIFFFPFLSFPFIPCAGFNFTSSQQKDTIGYNLILNFRCETNIQFGRRMNRSRIITKQISSTHECAACVSVINCF